MTGVCWVFCKTSWRRTELYAAWFCLPGSPKIRDNKLLAQWKRSPLVLVQHRQTKDTSYCWLLLLGQTAKLLPREEIYGRKSIKAEAKMSWVLCVMISTGLSMSMTKFMFMCVCVCVQGRGGISPASSSVVIKQEMAWQSRWGDFQSE